MLGVIYGQVLDLMRAREAFEQALSIRQALFGENDSRTLRAGLGIASMAALQGELEHAKSMLLDIQAQVTDETTIDIPLIVGVYLGDIAFLQGKSEEALTLYEVAWNEISNIYGDKAHPGKTDVLGGLCKAKTKLEPMTAVDACEEANSTLDQFDKGVSSAKLDLRKARKTLYERLGRTEDAERAQVEIASIEAQLAEIRSQLKGLPELDKAAHD